ncbi:MAG: DUF1289 domain-containing protein [Proteobacteria bacterium]|nr:DUF1289 domain-containing protein [Pseudomonadota bacterium]
MTPSPCIKVCVMDESAGVCLGCCRTLAEIAGWGSLPEATRAAIVAALPARRIALDLPQPATR